jgi:FkbM family methyltransferase
MRCAVLVFTAEGGNADRFRQSLTAAKAHGLGDFRQVSCIGDGANGPRDLRAAAQVAGGPYEWILAVTDAEVFVPDIFVKTAPALRAYDAVWGAAALNGSSAPTQPNASGAGVKPERMTRLAAQDLPTFFHAALRWWIGRTHFVRPEIALQAIGSAEGPAWYADYLVALWRNSRAYKTAQPLTIFEGSVPPVPEIERALLVDELARHPVFMPVHYGEQTLFLPYTGLNPVIEREQTRGQFFEHEELRFLAERLPRGLRIVDAGANTGNHTLFFSAVMGAETVVPIEPDARAAAAIRAVVAENNLRNVELACLGKAVGAQSGRLRPVYSSTAGLGATHFVPDPSGETQMDRLDALIEGPVGFLKIDVEGMEMAVLAGAEGLISRFRPAMYVEVLDGAIGEFLQWTDSHAYRIEKLFPDKAHCNYFTVPAEWA